MLSAQHHPDPPQDPKATEAQSPVHGAAATAWVHPCPPACSLLNLTKSGLKSELGKLSPALVLSWSPSRPCPGHTRMLEHHRPWGDALCTSARGNPVTARAANTDLQPGDTTWPGDTKTPCPSHAEEPRLGISAPSPDLNSWTPRAWSRQLQRASFGRKQ